MLPAILEITTKINTFAPKSTEARAFLNELKSAANKRLVNDLKDNVHLATATFLDPRYKGHFFLCPTILTKVHKLLISKLAAAKPVVEPMVIENNEDDTDDVGFWEVVNTKYQSITSAGPEKNPGQVIINAYNRELLIHHKTCPVGFWREKIANPLSPIALEALLPLASSVPSERVASAINTYVGKTKTRITDKYLNMRIFLHSLSDDFYHDL